MSNNPFESPEVPDMIGVPRRRLGTTLLRIFLLAAIGFVLVALLLPGLQRRDVARRTQCKINLKQIGLALHNYDEAYCLFPPA